MIFLDDRNIVCPFTDYHQTRLQINDGRINKATIGTHFSETMPNLAIDSKEQFNPGLHIKENQ